MPSLIDRVTRFGRSPKGQSLVQKAVSRFTGGNDSRKGRGRARTNRRAGVNRRTRAARRR
jgi:hypothetical protein